MDPAIRANMPILMSDKGFHKSAADRSKPVHDYYISRILHDGHICLLGIPKPSNDGYGEK